MTEYQPGSYFLTSIAGPVGFAIGLGQALAGAPSRYEHAGIIISADGRTVEAEPGGARFGHLADYAGRALLVCDGPVQQWVAAQQAEFRRSGEPFSQADMRNRVVREARRLLGVGYSPLDYVALALLHLRLPSAWVRHRVERSGRMICSQLVDAVYARAGIQLFDDGRLPGDVLPSDLAAWAEDWQAAQQVAA